MVQGASEMTEEEIIASAKRRFLQRSEARTRKMCKNVFGKTVFSGLCLGCGDVFFTFFYRQKYCSQICIKGALRAHWRGGRSKSGYGYISILKPDHPRANSSGHVLEHRFLMEQHLGRYLEKYENVHHKNGVRSDNRIENLELWCKPQPTGQKVIDLIEWIVDNYPDEVRAKLEVNDIVNVAIRNEAIV